MPTHTVIVETGDNNDCRNPEPVPSSSNPHNLPSIRTKTLSPFPSWSSKWTLSMKLLHQHFCTVFALPILTTFSVSLDFTVLSKGGHLCRSRKDFVVYWPEMLPGKFLGPNTQKTFPRTLFPNVINSLLNLFYNQHTLKDVGRNSIPQMEIAVTNSGSE